MDENDFINDMISRLTQDLNEQFEKAVVEGLKRKGFTFTDKDSLYEFVKTSCRCEDNVELKEKLYFVGNDPFLLWDYKHETDSKKFRPILSVLLLKSYHNFLMNNIVLLIWN